MSDRINRSRIEFTNSSLASIIWVHCTPLTILRDKDSQCMHEQVRGFGMVSSTSALQIDTCQLSIVEQALRRCQKLQRVPWHISLNWIPTIQRLPVASSITTPCTQYSSVSVVVSYSALSVVCDFALRQCPALQPSRVSRKTTLAR